MASRFLRARQVLTALCMSSLLVTLPARGEDIAVPLAMQSQLVARIAQYDRNFQHRAGPAVRVFILFRSGDPESVRAAEQTRQSLGELADIGGVRAQLTSVPFESAPGLAEACKKSQVSIVYVMPGLGREAKAVADALSGVDVLTVTAVPEYVEKGIVVGFDLVSGKPKIVVNIGRARAQNVAFKAELLKIVRVVE